VSTCCNYGKVDWLRQKQEGWEFRLLFACHSSLVFSMSDLQSQGHWFGLSAVPLPTNNLRQVVYMHVPLCLSR